MLSDILGEYCECGHEEAFHKLELETYDVCYKCYNQVGEEKAVHKFKIDGLVYVARRVKTPN